jgi:hypothetical protein
VSPEFLSEVNHFRSFSKGGDEDPRMRESIRTIADQKYWSILMLLIALHFLWAYFSISFFPIVGIEEPGYTIHSYNLATKGRLINEFFTECNHVSGWTRTIDKKILWPPLYPIILSWYLKIAPYDLIYLRSVSAFIGGIFLVLFAFFSLHFVDKFRTLLLVLFIETNILFRFISQEARPDIWVATSSLLMVMFLLKYLHEQKLFYLFISSAFASIAILLHWSGALVIGSFFVLQTFYCFFKKTLPFNKLAFSAIVSLVILSPYIGYVLQNFPLFEIQVIDGALNQTKQAFFSDKYSSSLFTIFSLVVVLSFFINKQKTKAVFLRDTFLALLLLMFILTFKFRYTLIAFPLCIVILASLIPPMISFIKDYHIIMTVTIASLIFSVGYMLPMSESNESYWKITQQIDPLIGNNAKVIGHPLIQWGLDSKKSIKISECDDLRLLNLDDFDFVIAERYFQEVIEKWPEKVMSRLDLIYHDESRTYNFKVYKIRHSREGPKSDVKL